MEFEPGDVVQMKSGGPVMTVERIVKDQKIQEDVVVCTWFETVGKREILQKEQFSPAVIEKYEPSFGITTTRI
jgi:uncharacterized protein YodC (DUF2158 family)